MRALAPGSRNRSRAASAEVRGGNRGRLALECCHRRWQLGRSQRAHLGKAAVALVLLGGQEQVRPLGPFPYFQGSKTSWRGRELHPRCGLSQPARLACCRQRGRTSSKSADCLTQERHKQSQLKSARTPT
ncbi:hypothetical protein NDU88_004474 [Pleurodeles waltl]|uniref:Uncharacterized protein n=1 Tax=Pleurodeles waltl TaxID=8319 RepID=A0AAV7WVG3_PLEWA|nr:hypothetical protein NDU88_004474 [Pleurodeles waltl]